jgi:hypothetical protein
LRRFPAAAQAPVQVVPGLKISLVRDPSNVLLELVESARR